MNESFSEHLVISFQRLLPLLSSILLVFLTYIPIDSFFLNSLRPSAGIMCAYFWLLYRSDIFNLGSIYILGFVEDIISAAPFGSNIFAILLLYVLVVNLSKYFNAKPFVVIWYGFMAISFVVFVSKWLMVSVYYGRFLPIHILMFGYLATVALYPLVSYINAFIGNLIREDA